MLVHGRGYAAWKRGLWGGGNCCTEGKDVYLAGTDSDPWVALLVIPTAFMVQSSFDFQLSSTLEYRAAVICSNISNMLVVIAMGFSRLTSFIPLHATHITHFSDADAALSTMQCSPRSLAVVTGIWCEATLATETITTLASNTESASWHLYRVP